MGEGKPHDPLIGTTVGAYRIERLASQSEIASVYELKHPRKNRRMALKVLDLRPEGEDSVTRFFEEGRAISRIGHPHIVEVTDFGHLPQDGRPYLLMEHLEGESLRALVERVILTGAETGAILAQVCSALGAAHEVEVVHRDVKPESIWLVPQPDGQRFVKLLDFGVAKMLGANLASVRTRTGTLLGTPRYMSPEQIAGRVREIDRRSDVYSLGVVLYEMLTGAPPYTASDFGDLLRQHAEADVPRPSRARPGVATAWDDVVAVALAKKREDRYRTMAELAAAIEDAARAPEAPVPQAPVSVRAAAPTPSGAASATGPAPAAPERAAWAPPAPAPQPAPPAWPPAAPAIVVADDRTIQSPPPVPEPDAPGPAGLAGLAVTGDGTLQWAGAPPPTSSAVPVNVQPARTVPLPPDPQPARAESPVASHATPAHGPPARPPISPWARYRTTLLVTVWIAVLVALALLAHHLYRARAAGRETSFATPVQDGARPPAGPEQR